MKHIKRMTCLLIFACSTLLLWNVLQAQQYTDRVLETKDVNKPNIILPEPDQTGEYDLLDNDFEVMPLPQWKPPIKKLSAGENKIIIYDMAEGTEYKLDIPDKKTMLESNIISGQSFPTLGENEKKSGDIEPYLFSALAQITDPELYPWCVNCKLFMEFPSGYYVGSGVLIDPKTVITAGHCVYEHEGGGAWAQSIVVIPAYENGIEHYGRGNVWSMTTWGGWVTSQDYDWDLAFVHLDRPVGALTGWHGYGYNDSDTFFSGNTFHNAGYPAASPYDGQYMYYWYGPFDNVQTHILYHNNLGYGGQSGGGTYFVDASENRIVYAALSHGISGPQTGHTRINSSKFTTIQNGIADNVPSQFDLVPLNVTAEPATINAGGQLTAMTYVIHNYSSATWSSTVNVDVYLSTNSDISTSDRLLQTRAFNGTIGPKSAVRVTASSSLPTIPSDVSGDQWLGIILDISDADVNNNDTDGWDAVPLYVNPASVIAVTYPNGGETWYKNSAYTITWTDNVTEDVKIELYKGGSFDRTVSSSTASDGSHDWTVPSDVATGSDYQIKITSTTNSSVYDYSDADFTITEESYVTVNYPNGGETLYKNSAYTITWSDNISEDVLIELYKGGSLDRMISSGTASDGSHDWTVPGDVGTGSDYQIKVTSTTNSSLFDYSDADFTITDGGCTPPAWTVDPGAFEFTMSLVGVIFFKDVESTDPDDIIAAFVGDDCRGVAQPTLFPGTGRYTFGITIFSNSSSGETITFKAFDHSVCEILNVSESYPFEANKIIGDDENPEELHAGAIVQTIPLNTGWNWISVNVENADMDLVLVLASIAPNGNFIKNQTSFATYYDPPTGWYSSNGLDAIDPTSMYMLKMDAADVLEYEGTPVDINTSISLNLGWNWIGYIPQTAMAINTALGGIAPNGDFIKNQTSFATYYDPPTEWYSSNGLDNMEPGVGYMLKMGAADELVYPAAAAPLTKERITADGEIIGPEWSPQVYAYEHSMAITGIVLEDDVERKDSELLVGAFVGQECRGISRLAEFPANGRYEFGLLVHGQAGENIHFKVFDIVSNTMKECENSMPFEVDGIIGDGSAPYVLKTAGAHLAELPTSYRLYQNHPNPFNPITTIAYDLPEADFVRLDIYDIRGQLVKTLQHGEQSAGRYELQWDARNENGLPVVSGLYFYKFVSGDFHQVKKMVYTK